MDIYTKIGTGVWGNQEKPCSVCLGVGRLEPPPPTSGFGRGPIESWPICEQCKGTGSPVNPTRSDEGNGKSGSWTPGPWVIIRHPSADIAYVGTTEGRECCTVYCTKRPEVEANAHLIAAAPDLYAACVALQMEAAAHRCGLRIADEAIAKAEGHQ